MNTRSSSRTLGIRGALALLLLALCLVARWEWNRRPAPGAERPPAAPRASAAPEPRERPLRSPLLERQPVSPAASAPAPVVAPLGEADLRAALRRLARTDMQDSPALEAALRPLLVPSANLHAVLALLKGGGLADGSHLSLEELGALLFNAPDGATPTLPAENPPRDGHAFVLALLRGLPDVLQPVQGLLAELLGAQRFPDGRPLLDLAYAAELERLARDFPEAAALFEGLLAHLLELDDAQADALQALYMGDEASPTLVGAGLSRWLEKHPASALAWAAERYDREDTPDEVRHAISAAVAQTAPVAEASRFLGERARDTMLVEFMNLGERAGGAAALEQDYWSLRIAGENSERARRMLVSGMASADTETLLALGADDPSPEVRAQAWTTAMVADHFQPSAEYLERLRDGYRNEADPHLGIPGHGVVSAAKNFAHRAKKDPVLRSLALDLLREVYLDRAQADSTRDNALEGLKFYLPAQEIEQLRARR